jgi:hypothetical protein
MPASAAHRPQLQELRRLFESGCARHNIAAGQRLGVTPPSASPAIRIELVLGVVMSTVFTECTVLSRVHGLVHGLSPLLS